MTERPRGTWFTVVIMLVLVVAIWDARELGSAARFFPWMIGIPALVLTVTQLGLDVRGGKDASADDVLDIGVDDSLSRAEISRGALHAFLWVSGLVIASIVLGFVVAVPAFCVAYLVMVARASWSMTLAVTAGVCALVFGVFEMLLSLRLPRGLLWTWL